VRARGRNDVLITDAADALDALCAVAGRTEFLAKIADMVVDAAIVRKKRAPEHVGHQVFARQDAPRRPEKPVEQLEFDGRERDRLAATPRHAFAFVERDVLDDDAIAGARFTG